MFLDSCVDTPWKKIMPSLWHSPWWHSTAASSGYGIPGNSSWSNFGYPFSFFSGGYTQTLSPCIQKQSFGNCSASDTLHAHTLLLYWTYTVSPYSFMHFQSTCCPLLQYILSANTVTILQCIHIWLCISRHSWGTLNYSTLSFGKNIHK